MTKIEKRKQRRRVQQRSHLLRNILWCKDQWNEVKKSNPGADFKEMSNLLGAKWRIITAEEKMPYEAKYQTQKEAYLKVIGNEKREQEAMRLLEDEQKQKTAMELLDQYLQFKQQTGKASKKTKKEKDPLKPKQPMSAYLVFSKQRQPTLLAENKNILEAARVTGEEWKNMTEKQRKPYEEIALKNKEKYMQDIQLYKQKNEEESSTLMKEEEELLKIQKQQAMQLLKKKEKAQNLIKKTKEKHQKKKDSDPSNPKKPASSFQLFSKESRKTLLQERPEINSSILTALISVKWKELSEEDRHVWNEKAATAMEAYKKELEIYYKNMLTNSISNLHVWNEKAATAMEAYKKELEIYNKKIVEAQEVNMS